MKIKIDQTKCRTAGNCVMLCPNVFRFQEGSKKAKVILEKIPAELHQKCRQAARECPNDAITIEEQ
jgi:ferredoxin